MKLTGRGCFGSRTSTIVKPSLNMWPTKACPLWTMTCTPSPRPFKSVLPTKSMLRAESGVMRRLLYRGPRYRTANCEPHVKSGQVGVIGDAGLDDFDARFRIGRCRKERGWAEPIE